jgi:hypothetical protein
MVNQREFRLMARPVVAQAQAKATPAHQRGTARSLHSLWLLLALLLISPRLLADTFTASVDRSQLSEQETLQLTLTHDPQILFGSPDLSAIRQDFEIVQGPNRMNSMRSVNGESSSRTEWTLTLMPKRTGALTIPAIEFKGERSQPLTITVKPLSDSVREQASQQAFFDIQLDQQPEYYVQGQILYTEKLYYRVNHRDANLSELQVEDARVEMLGDPKHYTSMINGERVGVYERRYVIYPEKAGTLVIPGQRFQALGIVQNGNDPWDRQRTMISAVTRPLELEISPIPANYPAAPWLPAQQLSLTEQFSADPTQWQVGEPITRTLIIRTEGMSASQVVLPDLPQPAGMKQYPDQSEYQDTPGEHGLSGQFQQAIAMVPTAAGTVVLPEIRLPWWNTHTNQLEYATLPARTVTVSADPAQTSPSAPSGMTANQPPSQSSAANTTLNNNTALSNTNPGTTMAGAATTQGMTTIGIIGWVVALLLLCSHLLLLYWWKFRSPQPTTQANQTVNRDKTPSASWATLTRACNQGTMGEIRAALLNWLATEMASSGISRIDQLASRAGDPELVRSLQQLDASLYAPENDRSNLDGKQLLRQLTHWRQQQGRTQAGSGSLHDSLYPS